MTVTPEIATARLRGTAPVVNPRRRHASHSATKKAERERVVPTRTTFRHAAGSAHASQSATAKNGGSATSRAPAMRPKRRESSSCWISR